MFGWNEDKGGFLRIAHSDILAVAKLLIFFLQVIVLPDDGLPALTNPVTADCAENVDCSFSYSRDPERTPHLTRIEVRKALRYLGLGVSIRDAVWTLVVCTQSRGNKLWQGQANSHSEILQRVMCMGGDENSMC